MRTPFLALLAFGCATDTVCYDLCVELVNGCEVAAYPDLASCQQGCLYDAARAGPAVVQREAECIVDASCDPFAIIECQHEVDAAAAR
jgi:hypothetical protein